MSGNRTRGRISPRVSLTVSPHTSFPASTHFNSAHLKKQPNEGIFHCKPRGGKLNLKLNFSVTEFPHLKNEARLFSNFLKDFLPVNSSEERQFIDFQLIPPHDESQSCAGQFQDGVPAEKPRGIPAKQHFIEKVK
jgi:hypothetical protein